MQENFIYLKEEDYVAKGSHNLVYKHPTNDDFLIKILGIVKVLGLIKKLETVKCLEQRLINSRWLGTFDIVRKINRYRLTKANIRELREIIRLRFYDEFLTQPPPFLQKGLGFVDTNFGFGILVAAEKDIKGNYAPTLTSLIRQEKINSEIVEALNLFCNQILSYDLIISDLHTDNLVYSYSQKFGNHFVLIDGIGDKNIVPILRFSLYFRNKAKLRKINKLKSRIPGCLDTL
jgi:hypothetical protein